ncbi:hypothetical protein COCSUDRAFT_54609 [Coccomyxa subellipsoidea C-169]|uniref:Uncharacterized protein n=1 Tax=Coccomyxa subellipsoidea (strain C-169) TaxID=574566 RepID=I0YMZ6_COCSC|nr:hypothetical protein COCSUDRAFT_54609 [Coccomyxa subellipsoidea C-169]EIE19765.1 hypothetical protein COCSUDRAFT_54609 [Coccomyxa subellipsoidea C-169]|eukprot:XP_005644309.1 hypothetical protein COCSUDRAFT_54609 [Coccomyxa subellipsoidea C-169]
MNQHRGVDSARWYMPPLEEEEVLQMLPAFPSVTEETALARFYTYGGSAQMFFLEADTEQDYRIKNHALDNLTWPMVTTAGGAPKQMDDISSVLFTIFVPEWREGNFKTTEAGFASRQMRKGIYKTCTERYGPQLHSWLSKDDPYPQDVQAVQAVQTRFLAFQRQLGITNPTAAYDIEPSAEDPFVSKRGSLNETSSSKSKKAGSNKAKGKGGSRSKKLLQAVLSGAGSTRLAARLPRAGMVPVRSVLAFPRRLPFRSHAPRLSYQKAQKLLC